MTYENNLSRRTLTCLRRAKKPLSLVEIAKRVDYRGINNPNALYINELTDRLIYLLLSGLVSYSDIRGTYRYVRNKPTVH